MYFKGRLRIKIMSEGLEQDNKNIPIDNTYQFSNFSAHNETFFYLYFTSFLAHRAENSSELF